MTQKNNYLFPNVLAESMKKVEMKTQLEAAMMSMFLLMIGMIMMSIYSLIYLTQGWLFKFLLIFNLLAGFLFMTSFLVTTYQQYISYMSAAAVQDELYNTKLLPKYKKNRVNQFLFFSGAVILILGIIFVATNKTYLGWFIIIIGALMIMIVFFRKNKNLDPYEIELDESLYKDDELNDEDYKILESIEKVKNQKISKAV